MLATKTNMDVAAVTARVNADLRSTANSYPTHGENVRANLASYGRVIARHIAAGGTPYQPHLEMFKVLDSMNDRVQELASARWLSQYRSMCK